MSGLKVVFWKELADHLGSRKFLILFTIVLVTSLSIVYILSQNIGEYLPEISRDYMFLNLFTISSGSLPSFIFFVSFFGPLIGIIFGFDAINSERSKGTISTVLSQPIYRDALINGKFLAGLTTISIMLISIIIIILGLELSVFGIVPNLEELWRIGIFFVASIIYIGFWMSIALLFSIILKQTSTSALISIMVWIFFTFFVFMIANVIADQIVPLDQNSTIEMLTKNDSIKSLIMHISPAVLFQEITTAILNPSARVFGIASLIKTNDLLPTPLPLGQSLMVIWPQFVGLIALMLICFAVSYIIFMRQEIRAT
ncbi:MAG TPA: ABC transporter [Candidatus Atribacteria bacterium]|jgi:ABC-2 type transport system permease protein|nr:ABC transporter [Candidatus Atribacteria bacterium]